MKEQDAARERALDKAAKEIFAKHPDVPCWVPKESHDLFTKMFAYIARLGFDAGWSARCEWVPVEKGLPDVGGEYLVTHGVDDGLEPEHLTTSAQFCAKTVSANDFPEDLLNDIVVQEVLRGKTQAGHWYWQGAEQPDGAWIEIEDVIAWMPLPEPWEANDAE